MRISVMSKVELRVIVKDSTTHPAGKEVWVPGTVLAVENYFGTYLINYLPPFAAKYEARWVSAEHVRLAGPECERRIYYRWQYGCCMVVNETTTLVVRTGPTLKGIEFDCSAHNAYCVPSNFNVDFIDEDEFVAIYRQIQAEMEMATRVEELVKTVEDARLRRETIADDVHNEPESQETEN